MAKLKTISDNIMIKHELRKIVLLLAVAVSGCSFAPDQNIPSTTSSNSYTRGDHLVSSEQRVILGKRLTVAWWSLFANEPLNQLIAQALRDNYTIAGAKQSVIQAEQAVKALQGSLWPQVSLLAAAGRQKIGVAFFGPLSIIVPPFSYYELGPTATWTVDLFGSTRYAIKQQEALREYQLRNLDATYLNLTSSVVTQALEIATVQAEIAATEQIVAADVCNLHIMQQAVAIGTHSKADILSAQSQLDTDRALLPPLRQKLNIAQHALSILIGKAPADWTPPNFQLDSFTLPRELPITIPSELLQNRPDILAAQANLNSASAAVGAANANFFPSLTLTGNYLREALTPGALFKAGNTAWAMLASLTQPLFQGGTLIAEKRKAEAAYKEMIAQYQQTVITAFQQVADALTALNHDAATISAQQQAVASARDSLELITQSFKAGTNGLMQVENAKRALAQAELNLVQARGQIYLDTVQLFVAVGGTPITDYGLQHEVDCADTT